MFKYLFVIFISWTLTYVVMLLTKKAQIYELWNSRRITKDQKVRVGGIAFILSFIISLPLITFVISDNYIWILLGLLIVFCGGLLDDLFDLRPLVKTLFDLGGTLVVVVMGQLYINKIVLPTNIIIQVPIFLNALLPVIWIICVINIMNLIDGLDGLASGISIISLGTIALVSFMQNDLTMLSLSITLALSLLGFLPWNWFPSKIIMGDCGSRSIGFLLGCISMIGFKNITFMSIVIPFLILAIPISDTIIAIFRRKLAKKSFSTADKGHIHHRLFNHFNGSQVKAVLSIYFITLMFSFSAVIYTISRLIGLIMIIFSIIITLLIFIKIKLLSWNWVKDKNEQKKESR